MRRVLFPIVKCWLRPPRLPRELARQRWRPVVRRVLFLIVKCPRLRPGLRRARVLRRPQRVWWTRLMTPLLRPVRRRRLLRFRRRRRPAPGRRLRPSRRWPRWWPRETRRDCRLLVASEGLAGSCPGAVSWFWCPTENGQFSPVTVSSDLFRPVPRSVFASFFDAPRAFRWAVAGIVAVSLLFGAAYVSMAVVSSRYQFREVAVSPGAVDLLQGGPLDRPHDPLPDRRRSCRSGLLARIMREGVDSGRDTRASVWYKRSVYKRLATTEAPA